jgi:predicted molibdopterin-dependent oxidoreductase YjgC
MVRLKINNIHCEVPDGTTVFEAALNAGINIPALCHKEGLPHYSSCMVCLVKDNLSNGFIPSCSALAQSDMDIDASGNDVVIIRKKAVELLLSEHRAECEALCRVVCPAGYNIPLMNRLLAAGNVEEAIKLSLSELKSGEIHCIECAGYCENACRRKKVDLPVSIRNMQLFISQKIKPEDKPSDNQNINYEILDTTGEKSIKPGKKIKKFSSHIGKLEAEELKEWLKECSGDVPRHRDITNTDNAVSESKSCMHCDCRASEDCRLRDIAEDLKLKDPKGKLVNAPAVKKINLQTNLIFENAKCIKCGLCVRVSADKGDEPALCFINRGFVSIISEPLTCNFVETMKSTAKECIEICPTGALAYFK